MPQAHSLVDRLSLTLDHMEGYAKVAQLMAKHEDFAILRRFKALNYQNLLYLQAQIIHLEDELQRIVHKNVAHPERRFYAGDWWTLAHSKGANAKRQWKKTLQIRKKLDQYNKALLKQVHMSKLDTPNKHDLDFLRHWFERPSMGFFPLRGLDRDAWHPDDESDLVAIKPRKASDAWSRTFLDRIMPLFHTVAGQSVKTPNPPELGDGIYTYEERVLASIVDTFTIVIAAALPILSVIVLYIFESNAVRLGLVAAFSVVFALALALMTNARKIEIFAAISAFTAVNVVFLANTLPASGCSTGRVTG